MTGLKNDDGTTKRSEPLLLEWIVAKLFVDLNLRDERFGMYRRQANKRAELTELIRTMLRTSKTLRRQMPDEEIYRSVSAVVFKALTMPPIDNNN